MSYRELHLERILAVALLTMIAVALWGRPARAASAEVFAAQCAMCHGKDASGNTPMGKAMKLRDLRSKEVQAKSDKALYAIIAKGKSPMPAFEGKGDKAQINDLVTYLRELAKKK